jgi:hypothetical protein
MRYVPGECCATALIHAGLSRREVVAALERELGLNAREASAAWLQVTLHHGEISAVRRVVRDLDADACVDLRADPTPRASVHRPRRALRDSSRV